MSDTDSASWSVSFSLSPGFTDSTRSAMLADPVVPSGNSARYTRCTPTALPRMSALVLSEKQECSSSWSFVSYATAMRSPASSPALSAPIPRRMFRTAVRGFFTNFVG
jgi:hypothetical protein